MEPGRQLDRVSARRRAEVLRLRPDAARGRSPRPAASRASLTDGARPARSARRSGRPTAQSLRSSSSTIASQHVARVPAAGGKRRAADRRATASSTSLSAGHRRRARGARVDADRRCPEVHALENGQAAPAVAPERRLAHGRAARHDRGVHLDQQGRHRGPRPDRQAADASRRAAGIRRCCGSTAGRTARTSTRSTSSASSSPPTATSSSR